MCWPPIVYMIVYILIGAHIVPLSIKLASMHHLQYKYYVIGLAGLYQILRSVVIMSKLNQNINNV